MTQSASPRWFDILFLLMIAALMAGLVAANIGCAKNDLPPLSRVVQARELYTSTLNVLTAARTAGKINDQTAKDIENYRRLAAEALNAMEENALAKNGAGYQSAIKAFDTAIDKLLEWRVKQQRGKS